MRGWSGLIESCHVRNQRGGLGLETERKGSGHSSCQKVGCTQGEVRQGQGTVGGCNGRGNEQGPDREPESMAGKKRKKDKIAL
jgi:hypothetical protein